MTSPAAIRFTTASSSRLIEATAVTSIVSSIANPTPLLSAAAPSEMNRPPACSTLAYFKAEISGINGRKEHQFLTPKSGNNLWLCILTKSTYNNGSLPDSFAKVMMAVGMLVSFCKLLLVS
jgi:hypothetical protein